MSCSVIPAGYKSILSLYETQSAIGKIKGGFAENLSAELNLKRVSAPLFVLPQTGLNDDLNGVERPVEFEIKETGTKAQIVHSLAKWKRMALHTYEFPMGEGIYTDMNAVRRDEEMDNLHSVYVDQWDWEKVIAKEQCSLDYLKRAVQGIVSAICDTAEQIKEKWGERYPIFCEVPCRDVKFITTQELEDMYPKLTPKARENVFLKEHKTAFVMQIGGKLKSGEIHDGRAPDYDNWQLNGDILFWNDILNCAFEVSSMGIRVDAQTLDKQLYSASCNERRELLFHKMLLSGELPQTMGGGIGQSRLCMLLLKKAHIGEVQSSVWDEKTIDICHGAGINLL
jgi:aspartate--ammonia ligase, AsnA-type